MNSLAIANHVIGLIAEKGTVVERKNIFDVLNDIKGAKILNVVSVTQPDLTGGKKNPFNNRILRLSSQNVQINYDYENAVNNIRAKNGEAKDFEASSSWYHVVVDEQGRLTPWARHNKTDELYLRYRLLNSNKSIIIDSESGDEISFDVIAPYMRKSSSTTGVEARTMKLDNVKAVVLGGVTYVTV